MAVETLQPLTPFSSTGLRGFRHFSPQLLHIISPVSPGFSVEEGDIQHVSSWISISALSLFSLPLSSFVYIWKKYIVIMKCCSTSLFVLQGELKAASWNLSFSLPVKGRLIEVLLHVQLYAQQFVINDFSLLTKHQDQSGSNSNDYCVHYVQKLTHL